MDMYVISVERGLIRASIAIVKLRKSRERRWWRSCSSQRGRRGSLPLDSWLMKGGKVVDVRKMRIVQLDVEPKYITEDSEVRVYLSVVYSGREEGQTAQRYRQWKKIQRRKKLMELGQVLVWISIKLLVALSVAAVSGAWAIQKAYEDRGYKAVGGEHLFILFTFIFTYWIMGYVVKE